MTITAKNSHIAQEKNRHSVAVQKKGRRYAPFLKKILNFTFSPDQQSARCLQLYILQQAESGPNCYFRYT